MAKVGYLGIDGVSRKVKKSYLGIDGVTRNNKKGYLGDENGVTREWFSSDRTISSLPVGSSVFMYVNNTRTEFIVVNQGRPSTLYDSSCDGTWLLMKKIYTTRAWNTQREDGMYNYYALSDVHNYLNNTFLKLFKSNIRTIIKQVKIPHYAGIGSDISSGNKAPIQWTLSTKIFLLSLAEVVSGLYTDGRILQYFNGSDATTKRIAQYNGTNSAWWLRTPRTYGANDVQYVTRNGGCDNKSYLSTNGIRPALILPSETLLDENFNVTA